MKKIFLNLLKQPITNSFLKDISKEKIKNEFFYNLKVSFNTKNFLVSLSKPVDPRSQFTKNYAHRASQSITMNKSFIKISKELKKKFNPKKILEIGSNDGVFLKNFDKKKIVAVEPCLNLANITSSIGYTTYPRFWNRKTAKSIIKKNSKFDLIYSANTISHIPDLDEVFKGIELALNDEGVFVFEDPYIGAVLKMNSYDQFYDEHVHLFSLISISLIVKKFNLKIFDVKLLDTHGGSIRFYLSKFNSSYKVSKRVLNLIQLEIKNGLNKFNTYVKFSNRVKKSKKDLLKLLKKLKSKNKKIISYGATYKSATIFNYCGIDNKLIDYVTDNTKNKQGKFTPGKHLPIKPSGKYIEDDVDYAFLGAWNFLKEIKNKEKKFLKRGGKFITHVPRVRLISK